MPIQLGNEIVIASIHECSTQYEIYFELSIPAIREDKTYPMYIEPYGDVYFYFHRSTPKEIKGYEAHISQLIFNHYHG